MIKEVIMHGFILISVIHEGRFDLLLEKGYSGQLVKVVWMLLQNDDLCLAEKAIDTLLSMDVGYLQKFIIFSRYVSPLSQ
jgi:hypothetical protein